MPAPTPLIGFDAANLTANSKLFSDPAFHQAVRSLEPKVIRVFGGRTANYWDWRAGTLVNRPDLPDDLKAARASMTLVTLGDWGKLIKTSGAFALFDLNMVTSSLDEQIAMLKTAEFLGIDVRFVELGSELYGSDAAYSKAFPSAADYGKEATRWIERLKREFPRVQVGAVGADLRPDQKPTDRAKNWNDGVLSTLKGAQALTFHPYWGAGVAAGASLDDPAVATRVVAASLDRWNDVGAKDLNKVLPVGMRAWFTEFNMEDRVAQVHASWAQALSEVVFMLAAAGNSRVGMVINHALVGSGEFAAVYGGDNDLLFNQPGNATGRDVSAGVPRPPSIAPTTPLSLTAPGYAWKMVLTALPSDAPPRSAPPPGPTTTVAPSATPAKGPSVLWLNPPGGLVAARFEAAGNVAIVVVNPTSAIANFNLPAGLKEMRAGALSSTPGFVASAANNLEVQPVAAESTIAVDGFTLLVITAAM